MFTVVNKRTQNWYLTETSPPEAADNSYVVCEISNKMAECIIKRPCEWTATEGKLVFDPDNALFLSEEKNKLKEKYLKEYLTIKNRIVPPEFSDVYRMKAEAARALIGGTGDEHDASVLSAEADARGIDVKALASGILKKEADAKHVAGLIEAGRVYANTLIRDIDSREKLFAVQKKLLRQKAELKSKLEEYL